jgi:DNA-binding transcriptional LysR family regulator
MNLASIDLNLLVALDALISEAHVGRAARKIGLSQPATSHALKRLRYLFSDPLLVRSGSRMELTPRAIGLRDLVTEALQRVKLLLVVDRFDPTKSVRRFTVMMQDHVAHLVVPALVNRAQWDAPGVTIEVLPWQSPASMNAEQLSLIDLVISCSTNDIAGFQKEPLFLDTEVVVVRKSYRSANRLRNLKTFLNAKHVAVVSRGLTEDPVDTWLRQEGLSRHIALRVPSYLQALQAVARADLVGFVPKRLAESLKMPLSLVVLQPPIDPGEYQEHFFYPRRAAQDSASLWLRGLSLEIAKELGRPSKEKRPPAVA